MSLRLDLQGATFAQFHTSDYPFLEPFSFLRIWAWAVNPTVLHRVPSDAGKYFKVQSMCVHLFMLLRGALYPGHV